ncbi:putative anti-sigma factor [Pedobacter sp. BAL39]|uniref:FecR family protein n=1 Tax=Pedobacter sp. BAL39 TaxID=391596 RepID=UPI0001559F6F|nr:FecR family protein [Pedobacter sp. BAL39]EDM35553.1 putative anti-sigma factor [Pedobacter sp. BAL39]
MGEKRNIKTLFERYRRGTATAEEKHNIAAWLQQLDAQDQSVTDDRVRQQAVRSKAILRQRLTASPQPAKVRKLKYWIPWAAAACLCIGLLTTLLPDYLERKQSSSLFDTELSASIIPSRSFLLLSNGRKVYLDTAKEGIVATDRGNSIRILGNEIRYEGKAGFLTGMLHPVQHTLVTAKGQQYHVVLPDSTRIWLNAGSRLSYPLVFSKNTRLTEMAGEAYFEVKRAEKWPFIVNIADRGFAVRVLGTAFNVSAYTQEKAIKTTLVSGRVELDIKGKAKTVVLKPAQKATYDAQDKILQVATVNTNLETDWISNRLVFRETPMAEALKRLEYFYNIKFDVRSKHIYKYTLTGTFDGKSLTRVLDYMRLSSEIQYTITHEQEGSHKTTIVSIK